jgi:tRNA threonylcarbamoyladenosine biosynthesis protein TsaB
MGRPAVIALGIDTSSAAGSVALTDGDGLVAELNIRSGKTHSARLLPAVSTLIRIAGISLDAIDLLSVATGPGSFTGLRIGMATAKGLALAMERPLTGFSTLGTTALAVARDTAGGSGTVCVLLDAGRGEVYRGLFECRDLAVTSLAPESAMSPETAAEGIPTGCVVCGGGLTAHRRVLEPRLSRAALLIPETPFIGLTLAQRALVEASRVGLQGLPPPTPNYLRLAHAERTHRK